MLRFMGANEVTPIGVDRLSFYSNFFIGNDTRRWITNVQSFSKVAYRGLYDGIDLVYGFEEGRFKYEFDVKPGADSAQIHVGYEGVDGLVIDRGGDLVVSTGVGEVRDLAPVSYQGNDEIECPFDVRGPAAFGFACHGRDVSRELVIDPIIYSSFLGGGSLDLPWHVTADAFGFAYVSGFTESVNFPVTAGAFDLNQNGTDGFIAKIVPDGKSLAWATYLGGSGFEWANGVTVDASGGVYVVGDTRSVDFPVTAGAFDTSFNVEQDAFVAKFTGAGMLAWATYLGGSESEQCHAVALDSLGNVVVASYTFSPDFPVTPGAFDVTYDGLEDGYVAKFDPTGRFLLWATYLAGSGTDATWAIALDSDDNVYATGYTNSTDFPVTPGAFDTTLNGDWDALVVKLDPTGSTLLWATYLGGLKADGAASIVFDESGNLFVGGSTNSADFPVTPGAFSENLSGSGDGFVAKMDAANSDLVWATFLGGSGLESGVEVALDASGAIYVAGETSSMDFPTTPDAIDAILGGTDDEFLAGLSPLGDALLYGTYIGGNGFDDGRGLAIDASGNQYLIGLTYSVDFPVTPDAFQTSYGGGGDAFVMKLGRSIPANTPPVLSWTGEPDFASDGLNPEVGFTATNFSYRVIYSDADNQTPSLIEVKIEKPLGTPWQTSQMQFDRWGGPPGNFTVGAIYRFNTTLPAGTDYWYSFRATDGLAWATGQPTIPIDAPDVIVDNPPTAVARASPTVAHIGDLIAFGIVSYRWDFGDGASDVTAMSTHAYASRAIFTATLTVWDTANQNDTDPVSVSIENRLPIANAGPDQVVPKKVQVALDGTGCSDADGDSLSFTWTQTGGLAVALIGADTPTPHFTPPTSGTYTFQLAVDDGYGGMATDTVEVRATNTPPVAEAGMDRMASKGTLVSLNGSGSSDPDGDLLTFSWIQISGTTVTLSGEDTPTPEFSPAKAGTYTIRLAVDDGDGGTSEDLITVTIWGLPPIADLVARPPSAFVGAQIEFDASGSYDPDGVIVNFSFQFGDSESESGPANLLNHSYANPGLYIVTLTVWDDDGNSSATSASVEVTFSPPSIEVTVNYKPIVALMFAIILLVAGIWSSKRRPWKGRKDRMAVVKAFAITSLPFVLLEAATGTISSLTGSLSIPPLLGAGAAIDLAILLSALAVALVRATRRT
jgi:hypothetical protein